MKSVAFLILFLFVSITTFSQNKQEKLKWREEQKLSWSDFKGEPKKSSSYSANTNSGISYSWNYSTATGKAVLNHEVFTNFYPNLSWVKKIENKDYLLAHEQLHFDISELHARKLRKALKHYEIGRNVRLDLKKLYDKIETERVAMQNQYDKETAHSENRSAEMRWRKFVTEELDKLQEYAL